MSITVTCTCGKAFPMPDFSAGQQVKCRTCGTICTIPALKPAAPPSAPVYPSRPAAPPAPPAAARAPESASAAGVCVCGTRVKMSLAMAGKSVPCARCGKLVKLSPGSGAVAVAPNGKKDQPPVDPNLIDLGKVTRDQRTSGDAKAEPDPAFKPFKGFKRY